MNVAASRRIRYLRVTDIGPLATEQILQDLDSAGNQIRCCRGASAERRPAPEQPGNFYLPTVRPTFRMTSPAAREEVFGPVALLFRVESIGHAVQLANDTPFGLGASAWTNDEQEQTRFVNELESGCVFINGMVASDPRLPFGGVKASGYGRELAEFGIREFVNIKTVWMT